MLPSVFVLLMSISVIAFWFIVYSFVRQKGLLAFMPPGLQRTMLEVSFFDIFVNIFIYRRISKMILAIFTPFVKANTPEEAKQMLKDEGKLPPNVYKALFRKVSATLRPKAAFFYIVYLQSSFLNLCDGFVESVGYNE